MSIFSRLIFAPFAGTMALPDVGNNPPGTSPVAEAPAPIRVLLVDDHEDTNRSLLLLLGRRGYKVKTATSLYEAGQLAASEQFDVLVSDMSLPDGSGLELLALMSGKPPLHGAIMLSGYSSDDDLERSRAAGFKAHLSKPVDVRTLDETIRRLVSASASPA